MGWSSKTGFTVYVWLVQDRCLGGVNKLGVCVPCCSGGRWCMAGAVDVLGWGSSSVILTLSTSNTACTTHQRLNTVLHEMFTAWYFHLFQIANELTPINFQWLPVYVYYKIYFYCMKFSLIGDDSKHSQRFTQWITSWSTVSYHTINKHMHALNINCNSPLHGIINIRTIISILVYLIFILMFSGWMVAMAT